MRSISTAALLGLLITVAAGCAASADNPPTPMTASFDMQPVPKRTEPRGAGGLVRGVFIELPAHLFRTVAGRTPIQDVRRMEDPDFPDERRRGIHTLVSREFAQRDPYLRRYRQIAQTDPDALVRAAAIRALNRSRDREAVPIFIEALSDQSSKVRWEATKALSNVPDASAVEPLMRTLGNQAEARDVRISAAEALRHYRNVDVARVLIGTLGGRDFSIAWQARWSLRILTGQDFRYDEAAWLQYLTRPDKPLS